MKKAIISFSLLWVICINLFSQNINPLYRNLNIEFSTEYRITPIYLTGLEEYLQEAVSIPVFYEEDQQLSGMAVNFGLNYHFSKINAGLKFIHGFRYGHIYFDTKLLVPNTGLVNRSINGLISDYHFVFEKKINLKNDFVFGAGIGYSLMNRGTVFSYTRQVGLIGDQPVYSTTSGNFSFSAFNVNTSVEKQNLFFTLGGYITDKHQFNQPSRLLILYAKIGYYFKIRKTVK